jgi:glutamate-1-semialdehyde 2,1-aminomutase
VFLLSTTHGAETHGFAAAIATMRVYQSECVIEHLYAQGNKLKEGIEQAARRHGVDGRFKVVGRPCCLAFATLDSNGEPSQAYRSLFLQETIRRGVLMPSLVVSYTHDDAAIMKTIEAVDGALAVYAQALESGASRFLVGRPSQVVFRRYNNGDEARVSAAAS